MLSNLINKFVLFFFRISSELTLFLHRHLAGLRHRSQLESGILRGMDRDFEFVSVLLSCIIWKMMLSVSPQRSCHLCKSFSGLEKFGTYFQLVLESVFIYIMLLCWIQDAIICMNGLNISFLGINNTSDTSFVFWKTINSRELFYFSFR